MRWINALLPDFAPAALMAVLLIGCVSACISACVNIQKPTGSTEVTSTPQVQSVETHNPQPASENVAISGTVVNCKNGNDVRILHSEPRAAGCNLNYTKAGRKASIANSAQGTDRCDSVATKVRTKLESSGFTCQ